MVSFVQTFPGKRKDVIPSFVGSRPFCVRNSCFYSTSLIRFRQLVGNFIFLLVVYPKIPLWAKMYALVLRRSPLTVMRKSVPANTGDPPLIAEKPPTLEVDSSNMIFVPALAKWPATVRNARKSVSETHLSRGTIPLGYFSCLRENCSLPENLKLTPRPTWPIRDRLCWEGSRLSSSQSSER